MLRSLAYSLVAAITCLLCEKAGAYIRAGSSQLGQRYQGQATESSQKGGDFGEVSREAFCRRPRGCRKRRGSDNGPAAHRSSRRPRQDSTCTSIGGCSRRSWPPSSGGVGCGNAAGASAEVVGGGDQSGQVPRCAPPLPRSGNRLQVSRRVMVKKTLDLRVLEAALPCPINFPF